MTILQALVNGITQGTILALAALGLTLVFGISKFPNAAHGDYMTVGAYGAYFGVAVLGLSIPLAALVGIAASIGVGLLFYATVFKKLAQRSGAVSLIVSIGIALFVRHAIIFISGTGMHTYGLPIMRAWRIFGIRLFPMDILFSGISLGAMTAVHLVLKYSAIGRKMRAVSDDPQLARVSGIRISAVQLAMWSMSLTLAGLAGILLGMKTVIDPLEGWNMLLPAFAAAILGGFGNPAGAVVGGIIIGISQELTVLYFSETYKVAISFAVIAVVLLIRPWGLLGRQESIR